MHKSTSRRTVGILTAALIASATVAGCSPAAPSPEAVSTAPQPAHNHSPGTDEPLTIGLTYIPNVQFSPVYVAQQSGYISSETTLRHHGQSEGLFTALLAGREQVVVAGADEAAAAKSDQLLVIAPYYEQYPVAVITRKDSEITSMADLKGKTIGVPGHYGEAWYGLLAGLRSAGMTTDDITVQEIGFTQQAALSTGKVDGVVGFVNNDAVQFRLNELPVTVITPDVRSLRSVSLVTTKKFAESHPQQVKDLVAGMFRAYTDLGADPAAGVEATAHLVPELSDRVQRKAAEATMDATVELFPASTRACAGLNAANGAAMVDELKAIGLSPQVDGSELFTDRYCG